MISEAISSCKPVYILRPEIINSDENYQRILDNFELNNKIKNYQGKI